MTALIETLGMEGRIVHYSILFSLIFIIDHQALPSRVLDNEDSFFSLPSWRASEPAGYIYSRDKGQTAFNVCTWSFLVNKIHIPKNLFLLLSEDYRIHHPKYENIIFKGKRVRHSVIEFSNHVLGIRVPFPSDIETKSK